MNKTINAKSLAFCGLFIALISIGSKVQIPTGLTPITLQGAVILISLLTLPPKLSLITIAVYIIAGLIGLPVFAHGGGFSYLLTQSFGYLLGYLIVTIINLFVKTANSYPKRVIFCIISILIVHIIGVTYTYFICNKFLNDPITFGQAIIFGSLIFLPTDFLWCFICPLVANRLKRGINF